MIKISIIHTNKKNQLVLNTKNFESIIRKTKCSRSAKRNDIFAKRNVYVFSSL